MAPLDEDLVRVTVTRPGARPMDITPLIVGLRWTTLAVGGYGAATITTEGWRGLDFPYLSEIRVTHGTYSLYEGRVEDVRQTLSDKRATTTIQAFGAQRLLENTSIRRAWHITSPALAVPASGNSVGLPVTLGNYDPDDPTKRGAKIAGSLTTITTGSSSRATLVFPDGVSFRRVIAEFEHGGSTTMTGSIKQYPSGTTLISGLSADATVSVGIDPGTTYLAFIGTWASAATPTEGDYAAFREIRLLGIADAEDSPGGFFGGTILTDLISLIPGLHVGDVEVGSEFVISGIERIVRDTALSVVNEIVPFYEREWAVWEEGRFDWTSSTSDTADWFVAAGACGSIDLDGTVDGVARRIIVTYTDAADSRTKEATYETADLKNPYIRVGLVRDFVQDPGVPMSRNSAPLLAAKIARERTARPTLSGSITIPAVYALTRVGGGERPAFTIRAGENIRITELPYSDPFAAGRDGESLFHIVGTDTDLVDGTVTLQIESFQKRLDVLFSRLAAATRRVTG